MTVGELIAILQKHPTSHDVFVASGVEVWDIINTSNDGITPCIKININVDEPWDR